MNEQTFSVEYDSNNSGGGWWLSDEDWHALEKDGWQVEWLGSAFCHSKYAGLATKHTAPNTCATQADCPGHRGAESYEEALAATNDKRWLGALAKSATIDINAYSASLAEGVAQHLWSAALPLQDANAEGCNCCGQPHSFWAEAKK